MAKKPSMGRQKIKIAKIEIKNHLQVTFSKRRSGLFKKASELCTLCGVEIAIVVFSPAGKVFSFGHPNVESVIDRFLTTRNLPPSPHHHHHHQNSNTYHIVEAHRNASVRELNLQLTHILNELEGERKRGETLDSMRKASQSQFWWESPIEKMSLHEVEQLRESMEELKKNVGNQASRILVENANTLSLFGGSDSVDLFETKPTHITSSNNSIQVHNNFGYAAHTHTHHHQGLF